MASGAHPGGSARSKNGGIPIGDSACGALLVDAIEGWVSVQFVVNPSKTDTALTPEQWVQDESSREIPGCSPDLINEALRSRDNRSVIKLAVMERKVPPNVHVFRVKEWRWPILVDDVAKSALSKASHDGLIFLEIEHE
jgi:hypothetical protein